jgi:hypothetical protein
MGCRDRHLLPLYNTPIDLLTDSLYADAGLLIQVHQHDWAIPAGEWKDGRVRSPRTPREQNIRDVMTVMQVRENRVKLGRIHGMGSALVVRACQSSSLFTACSHLRAWLLYMLVCDRVCWG